MTFIWCYYRLQSAAVIIYSSMKKSGCIGILLLVLAGCQELQISDTPRTNQLTPYITQTASTTAVEIPAAVTETASAPAPTATAIIHEVALGETMSSIALQYGVPMDAITRANPDAIPTTMIVGDELVIPSSNIQQSSGIDPAIKELVQISDPGCIQSRDSGLWCAAIVENKGQIDLENIIVTFSLQDSDGNIIEEKSVPTLMRHTAAGETNPAVVFIDDIPDTFSGTVGSLFSAQMVEASTSPYLTVEVEEELQTMEGRQATISGRMRVEVKQEQEQADIWIGAAAFDADGALVGVRRVESTAEINQEFNFSITVYSSAGSIVRVVLYKEGF